MAGKMKKQKICNVNFNKILREALAPIFFGQKITKPNCKQRKASKKNVRTKNLLGCKMLVIDTKLS